MQAPAANHNSGRESPVGLLSSFFQLEGSHTSKFPEESCVGKGGLIRTRRSWTAQSPEPNCLGASLVSP